MTIESVLITGANVGLGKDAARQFALRPDVRTVYLGCRNQAKAEAAKADLEKETGRQVFKIVIIDVSDFDSVRSAVKLLDEPVDALIMNAGGMAGGAKQQQMLSKYGATNMVTTNVLGHILLAESLVEQGKLKQVAVYSSSKLAVGVPMMGISRPQFESHSVAEYRSVINGTYFKKNDVLKSYAFAKLLATQWMASASRKYPEVRFVSVSPGATIGTDVGADAPQPFKLMYGAMAFMMPTLGFMHNLETGAARYVEVATDESCGTGHFYASKNQAVGEMIRWDEKLDYLGNTEFQDHCSEALHEFIVTK